MRITNPSCSVHEGAVYSIHLHPTLDKLLTSGQGPNGGLVVVWNLSALLTPDSADVENSRILSKISHQATVNCVRWSNDGSKFVCASDDKSVTIYEYGGRVQSAGSIGEKKNGSAGVSIVEKYRVIHTLHGHSMEVLGVEWSQDGRFLASCSMDNTVIVYDTKKFEKLVVLRDDRGGHTGPVKGISWDPIGKYLATQSADKTVRLWKTENWQCDKTISEPFDESGQTTMFTRLDWSPDGQFLVAPCAMNNTGPTGQIIRRRDWNTSIDLVGHRKATSIVRMCPQLVEFVDQNDKTLQVSLLAVGARDRALSIWVIPKVKRPVLVLNNLFNQSINDISWREKTLVVSSQDGTIKCLYFDDNEIGRLMTKVEMGDVCMQLYKQRPIQYGESSVSLDHSMKEQSSFIDNAEEWMTHKTQDKQVEVPSVQDITENAVVTVYKKNVETLQKQRTQQLEVRTEQGKRRIQPIFLGSTIEDDTTNSPTNSHVVAQSTPASKPSEPSFSCSPQAKRTRVETSTDESTAPESSDSSDDEECESTIAKEDVPEKYSGPANHANMMLCDFKKPQLRAVETRVQLREIAAALDVPEVQAAIVERVVGVITDTVEVNNEWICNGVRATYISYQHGSQQRWNVVVPQPVAVVAVNRYYCIVGCFDRSVRVFSSTAGRLECCLQLDGTPVRVGLTSSVCYALSQNANISTWDLSKCEALLSHVSIADCVSNDASLETIALSSNGVPVLTFAGGEMFTYSSRMQSWIIVDSLSSLSRLSEAVTPDEIPDGQLGRHLKRRRRAATVANVPSSVRCSIKEGTLESWLLSAKTMESKSEYSSILNIYVTTLCKTNSLPKLREVLRSLEGCGSVAGLSKSLLRESVTALINTYPAIAPLVLVNNKRALF